MNISPFFHNLRSAYQAELDDLRSDSEGHDVLKKRLAEKRRELGFLVQMMELSPEMVAVVLHQALRFASPAAMDHLVSRDADDLPDWDSISGTVDIAPWAQETVQTILKEPMGEWFMTIASALEYMQHKPLSASERAQLADEDEDGVDGQRGGQGDVDGQVAGAEVDVAQRGEAEHQQAHAGRGQPDEFHRDAALVGPVDVLQVQDQRELVQDQRHPDTDRHGCDLDPRWPLGGQRHQRADDQQNDAGYGVVDVHAALGDVVAERSDPCPDHPGDHPGQYERQHERRQAQE